MDHRADRTERGGRPRPGPDWAWRRRVQANRHTHRVFRLLVGVVGALVVALGIILIPFPGPGWAIVFLGVAIWASEFDWAHRLLGRARGVLSNWNGWVGRQGWPVRGVVGLATLALVLLVFWALFALTGVPTVLPDPIEDLARRLPGA